MYNDKLNLNSYKGIIVKTSEILLFYPLHSIIYYQHINNSNLKKTIKILNANKNFYSGIRFQLMYLPINKFIDLQTYTDYGSNIKGGIICSLLKSFTYPINTFEVHYNLNNSYPKFTNLYNGYYFYFISNSLSYVIWFNTLEYFNKKVEIKSNILKNAYVGFISGIIVDVIMNPLRVIKTNLQNNLSYDKLNFNNIMFRGIKSKLILSAFQSSYFNILINNKLF
tara:strand:- start:794 stop:1465 length:672 start_codon:yes stop_codon:yes gene_type:complete